MVLLGSLLQRLAALQGYCGQMPRYYGAQIRGGATAIRLSFDIERPSLPHDIPDILVCFDFSQYHEIEDELGLGAKSAVLYDGLVPSHFLLPDTSLPVNFDEISQSITGSPRNKNIVALGTLARMLPLSMDDARAAIDEDGELRVVQRNLPAFLAGVELVDGLSLPVLELSPAADQRPRVLLHGNSAVAEGAVRAGCRAFFGYPITPASEIMQAMEEALGPLGGVYLQAEDEIASAGMVLGASLTGMRALTATSGPGLDLMTEMLGLASAAEIPMVIVDVQRGGPSTGIPSKSEQSDLGHAVCGGHGDAPRAVLAAWDIESCCRLASESVNIAEEFQTPVILLSDQWLGQTVIAVHEDMLKAGPALRQRKRPLGDHQGPYQRYAWSDDGISPMANVGDKGFTYQTSGLTHDEEGRPAFDFQAHQRCHEKRHRKLETLKDRHDLVKVMGAEDSRAGIIAWGSTAQVVIEVMYDLDLQKQVKICLPELLCPLPNKVQEFMDNLDTLLVVELDFSGQFHAYLRSCLELPARTRIYARAGGRPFSRTELAGVLTEFADAG